MIECVCSVLFSLFIWFIKLYCFYLICFVAMLGCTIPACNFVGVDHGILVAHYYQVHRVYLCDVEHCMVTFKTARNKREHIDAVHSGHQYRCSSCLHVFKQSASFYKHRAKVVCGGRLEKFAILPTYSEDFDEPPAAPVVEPIVTTVIAGCSTSLSAAPMVLSSVLLPPVEGSVATSSNAHLSEEVLGESSVSTISPLSIGYVDYAFINKLLGTPLKDASLDFGVSVEGEAPTDSGLSNPHLEDGVLTSPSGMAASVTTEASVEGDELLSDGVPLPAEYVEVITLVDEFGKEFLR